MLFSKQPHLSLAAMRNQITKKIFTMLALTVISSSSSAQNPVYKCKSASGAIEFSDRPCETNAVQLAGPKSSSSAQSADSIFKKPLEPASGYAEEKEACVQNLNSLISFKDPDSVKVGGITYIGYRRTNTQGVMKMYLMRVNAKNSFGGYVGEKLYECNLSEDGSKVVRITAM